MATQKKQALCFNNSGFSLTELLAVIGVFSILAAIAVPNINAQREVYRLNGAARAVLGDLMWARTKAVQENNQFVVSYINNHTYTILDAVGGGLTTKDIQDNFPNVTLAVTSGASPVTFDTRGTTDGAIQITLNNTSGSRTVAVSVIGSVKIQ